MKITPPHLPTTFDSVDKACARFIISIDPFAKVDSDVQSAPRGMLPISSACLVQKSETWLPVLAQINLGDYPVYRMIAYETPKETSKIHFQLL